MYEVEKNIPITPKLRKDMVKYPFAQMAVGDSFSGTASRIRTIRSAAYNYSQQHVGVYFSIKLVEENGESKCRCWRVA